MWTGTEASSSKARILVVGDVMLDCYVIGKVSRISPEAPVPVLRVAKDEVRPGGAANVAANIAAMGGACCLLSITGRDRASDDLADLVRSYGSEVAFVTEEGFQTTKKTRITSGAQQIVRVDREDSVPNEAVQRLWARYCDMVKTADIVVFSDYGKGVLRNIKAMIAHARSLGKLTLVDPKLGDADLYRGADIIKPNASEFALLFGETSSEDEMLDRARRAIETYGFGSMVLTRGPEGAIVIPAAGETLRIPTQAREVFDVSGAGDTMISAIAVALTRGHSVPDAVLYGNLAASVAVARLGTYVVTASDIERAENAASAFTKLPTVSDLVRILDQERRHGQKIVFTNGCFDILHPGHVRYLEAARALGDVLVVGLNSDASVRGLKGETRPVNTYLDRAEVMAGLASVSFVVEFDAPTPIDLITQVRPDILVKGGDYEIEKIVGYEFVTSYGGEVVTVSFHQGFSSTSVIGRMKGGG